MKTKYLKKIRKGYRYSFNDDGTVDVVDRETLKHKVHEHVLDFMLSWLRFNEHPYIVRRWFNKKGKVINRNFDKALGEALERLKASGV